MTLPVYLWSASPTPSHEWVFENAGLYFPCFDGRQIRESASFAIHDKVEYLIHKTKFLVIRSFKTFALSCSLSQMWTVCDDQFEAVSKRTGISNARANINSSQAWGHKHHYHRTFVPILKVAVSFSMVTSLYMDGIICIQNLPFIIDNHSPKLPSTKYFQLLILTILTCNRISTKSGVYTANIARCVKDRFRFPSNNIFILTISLHTGLHESRIPFQYYSIK